MLEISKPSKLIICVITFALTGIALGIQSTASTCEFACAATAVTAVTPVSNPAFSRVTTLAMFRLVCKASSATADIVCCDDAGDASTLSYSPTQMLIKWWCHH